MLERLALFQSWGWDVQVEVAVPESTKEGSLSLLKEMNTPLEGNSYKVDGIECRVRFDPAFHPHELSFQKPMEDFFLSVLRNEQPDLVWAHFTDFFAVTSAMLWNPEQSWIIQTDNEYPRFEKLAQYPSIEPHYRKIKKFMVASKFMQQSVQKDFPGAETMFLPNPVHIKNPPKPNGTGKYFLFVNPVVVKGVEFMFKLVSELPEASFLFVGNWATEKPGNLPGNVDWIPRQDDVSFIFKDAKALLMPSLWDEAFGRLAIEAMAYGVPVIVSDRGALPDTVGKGGLVLPLQIAKWKEVLLKPMSDFKQLREAGLRRYDAYQEDTSRRIKILKMQFCI